MRPGTLLGYAGASAGASIGTYLAATSVLQGLIREPYRAQVRDFTSPLSEPFLGSRVLR